MIISLVFDTTVRNISNLNFNIYTSFMVATALELPADLLSIVGLNWIGRRWSSAISLSVCGATMFSCALLPGILAFSLFLTKYLSCHCQWHFLPLFHYYRPPWSSACDVHGRKIHRNLRHQCWIDDCRRGDANWVEMPGSLPCQCIEHGGYDGLSIYSLFGMDPVKIAFKIYDHCC